MLPNRYYDDVTSAGSFSRIAYVDEELAGAICCFVVTKGKDKFRRKEVNISTIGVFKHFRRKVRERETLFRTSSRLNCS